MSFGIGIMDIAGVTKFAWRLYKTLRDSSDDFKRLANEVASLHTILLETEDILENEHPHLDNARRRRLFFLADCCRDTLEDVERLLNKYESLGTQAMRTWDRMRWGVEEISEVRRRLQNNATNLGAFTTALNNSSLSRLERKMTKLITEVRAGLREGSVVTASDVAETIDTPNVWAQLQRELEDVGISESVIEENREHISSWFKNTLQDGLAGLDEDASTLYSRSKALSVDSGRISPTTVPGKVDDNAGSAVDDGASDQASVGASDGEADGTLTPLPIPIHRDSGYGGSTRENSVSSMKSAMTDFAQDLKRTTGGKTVEESLNELTIGPPKQVQVKKKASPSRLLLKLLQKDDAIIQAASDGDAKKVAKLISLGMNINARDRWGWSALSMCGYGGHTEIARILLEHGANLDNIDVDGESPEDLARNRGNREMVLLFEEARKVRDQKTREMDDEQPRKAEV